MDAPDFTRSSYEFLVTEVETGLTFARIALDEKTDEDKITRNTRNARAAFDAVLRFRDRVALGAPEAALLERTMADLRRNLVQLGEDV